MSSIDQQFVEFVVKSLVSQPDKVVVERRIDEKGVLLELTVSPEDLGRVIGKHGATAQSIRTLLRALGTKNDARYNLKIVDNGTRNYGGSETGSTSSDEPNNETTEQQSSELSTEQKFKEDNSAEVTANEPEVKEEQTDRFNQTRKELAEFDDLDV